MKYPFGKYVILIFCFLLGTANAADVIVKGVGANRTIALSEAFKEAVRQGIGTYIESNTIVQNDEIIKDNIIELAYGYVENYKVLSESQKGKTYHIRIQANVSNEAVSAILATVLPANTLTEKDRAKLNIQIDNDISAKINQHLKLQRKAAIDKVAAKICRKIYKEYLKAFLLTYEFVPNKIEVTSATTKSVSFQIKGSIGVNRDLYNVLLNSLIAKFQRVLRQKIEYAKIKVVGHYSRVSFDYGGDISPYSFFAIDYDPKGLFFQHSNKYGGLTLGYLRAYHLNNVPFLKDFTTSDCKVPEMLICFVNKKGDVIYPAKPFYFTPLSIASKETYDFFFLKRVISQYFYCLNTKKEYTIPPYGIGEYTYSCELPLEIARNVAGVKGFLINNNPEGEALLNQLLKEVKK